MGVRKEQVLALASLAVVAWVWLGSGGEPGAARVSDPKWLTYEAPAPKGAPLLSGAAGRPARVDWFTEPRETRPLPPRDLPFPPLAPLSLCALPLEPGLDFGLGARLFESGQPVEGVALQPVAEVSGSGDPAAAAASGPGDAASRRAQLEKTYDQVYVGALPNPLYGWVEVEGVEPWQIENLTNFDDHVVRLREFNTSKSRFDRNHQFDRNNPDKVRQVRLARTLHNEVMREVHRVPDDAGHLEDRAKLIGWLLGKAREAAWVYDHAWQQAQTYAQLSGGDLEGLRWQLRVLQARGDLAGEYALLDGLTGPHRDTAFRYEGLGRVKWQLGLHADAEADLRQALELGRTDPRPAAALIELLLDRGRSREVAPLVQRCEQHANLVLDAVERVRLVRAVVAGRLALGDTEAARAALALLPPERTQPYLAGCIAYAAGNLPLALDSFRLAVGGSDSAAAQLGQAATLARQGQWQAAYDLFAAVADQSPLWRHRAYCGEAYVCLRLGQNDTAVTMADRALEANPQDPYAHYLRARGLRLQGQLSAALDSVRAALRLRDDFVPAVAEMAVLQSQRANVGSAGEIAGALVQAMRYADRAVVLAGAPPIELLLQQGLLRFAAGQSREAAEAFTRARDATSAEGDRQLARGALAVIEYSRGLVDEALASLQRFTELPKDHAMRRWAETTIAAIEDHAEKEVLEDRFERGELGGIWPAERDGSACGPVLDGRRLFLRGKLSRTGEVSVERKDAVKKAKNFLAVGIDLQLGAGHARGAGFAGLRIETARGSNGQADTQVVVGIREDKPHLRIVDNREEPRLVDLAIPGFDPRARHSLEIRLVPRGDAQSRLFALQVSWGGAVVHEQELKGLSGSSGGELRTVLFASGNRGNDLDAAFDDYRLERRKER
jgi:tetratricopeptide (TPR) repeat protein